MTKHHVIGRSFLAPESTEILVVLCRDCHSQLHKLLIENTRLMIRNQEPQKFINVGATVLDIKAGSQFEAVTQSIDSTSVLYGVDFFNKESNLKKYFEVGLSGGNVLVGTGSPLGWFTYVIAQK